MHGRSVQVLRTTYPYHLSKHHHHHSDMKNYYAVRVGYNTGIYDNLDDAKDQIRGYSRAQWRGFNRWEDAQAYLDEMNQSEEEEEEERNVREDLSHYDEDGNQIYEVYTDGACSGNGYYGAAAGVGVYFGANNPNNICKRLPGSIQTNNRAELGAIKEAYEAIIRMNDGDTYEIYTDSAYAINCLTKWCTKWYENDDWTNYRGERVANKTLIQSIIDLVRRPEASNVLGLAKVQAHENCVGNNEADELAGEGVRRESSYYEDMDWEESDRSDDGEGGSDGDDGYYY